MDNPQENLEINLIVEKIKKARKYKYISQEIIESQVQEYIRKNPQYQEYKEKFILKEIKAKLHRIHGSFQIQNKNQEIKKRTELLEELKKNLENLRVIEEILETNNSTKERLKIYPELYKRIFKLAGEPKSILDLGAGLNPLSICFSDLNLSQINYYSYDISDIEKDILNEFYNSFGIKGRADILDLSNLENYNKLMPADLCFMFKFLDVIELNKKGHKFAEQVIKYVLGNKVKCIVVSFSTKTLSGKPMNFPHRGWIERMLNRLNFLFHKIVFDNEIFYVITMN
jgi:hypothetical protein